jgi:hypothetical protein
MRRKIIIKSIIIFTFVLKMFTMIKLSSKVRLQILTGGLAITAFALPLSVFLISVGQFIILLNWLADNNWCDKLAMFKERSALWFIVMFYMVHLVWLFNTSDFSYAAHDLKIKLPFLIIPLIIGTSQTLYTEDVKRIILAFCAGVLMSSLYSTFKIFTIPGDPMAFGKEISPFVSHIRLSLMVDFAIFAMFWLFKITTPSTVRYTYLVIAGWFFFFLLILQSLTGIVVLVVVSAIYVVIVAAKSKQLMVKWFIGIILVLVILLPSTYLIHTYTFYFSPLPVDTARLPKYTLNGNPYTHNTHLKYLESGNYTYLFICEKELKAQWERRSKLNYDSVDLGGNQIKYTIFRYMTSRDLSKDSVGVSQLSGADIRNIENGVANSMYIEKNGIKPRVYRLMWELYHYQLGADPTGYSVAQRIEYLKTAEHIIQRNFWLGTGTGDVVKAFQEQYVLDNSPLGTKWRLRAHNQFITFFLTFGFIGFIIVMASLFCPPFLEKRYNNFLFLSFFILFILSMLNEDTLETHAGISFIAIFYAVLLFAKTRNEPLIAGKEDIEVS